MHLELASECHKVYSCRKSEDYNEVPAWRTDNEKENGELADVTHRFMTRNSMSYATELISTTPMDELQHRDATIFSTRCNSGNITTENRNFRREVHSNALIFNKNEVPEGISLILVKPLLRRNSVLRDAAKFSSRRKKSYFIFLCADWHASCEYLPSS